LCDLGGVDPRIWFFARLDDAEDEERDLGRAGIGREGNEVGRRFGEVRIVVRTSICRLVMASFLRNEEDDDERGARERVRDGG